MKKKPLTITNRPELNEWMEVRRLSGTAIHSVIGYAPEGSTYVDGTPIKLPVTVAWKDSETGEVFNIEYAPIE